MKSILIVYATREGHTKRIAEYLGEKIRSQDSQATVSDVRELPKGFSLANYAAAVIAASVHRAHHEPEIIRFVKDHLADLNRMFTALVSVSLSQAGAQDEQASSDHRAQAAADVKRMTDLFVSETHWHPTLIRPVAGALMYSKYNFLVRMIMKHIASRAGASPDVSQDHVFTHWRDLDDLAKTVMERLATNADLNHEQ